MEDRVLCVDVMIPEDKEEECKGLEWLTAGVPELRYHDGYIEHAIYTGYREMLLLMKKHISPVIKTPDMAAEIIESMYNNGLSISTYLM